MAVSSAMQHIVDVADSIAGSNACWNVAVALVRPRGNVVEVLVDELVLLEDWSRTEPKVTERPDGVEVMTRPDPGIKSLSTRAGRAAKRMLSSLMAWMSSIALSIRD